MRVLITGGGTGGHIYPAIAIAKKLKQEFKDIDILYIGTNKGLERELVPKEGINFKTITVTGFQRKISPELIKTINNLIKGLKQSRQIIKSFKPDFVIGTGGYVCGPVVLMASLMKIKTAIHEQNVIPGATNRILSKFVDRIYISFDESKKYFNVDSNKIVFTGNPIREEFNIDMGHRVAETELRVLSFGGSRGAKKINETIRDSLSYLNGMDGIRLTHITGKYYYDEFIKSLNDLTLSDNLKILPYAYDMPSMMKDSDIIISRAGAITIAEITALGLPSILVPSPNVANNHQEYNARFMEKAGASVVILEKDFTSENLINLLKKFMKDRSLLKKMGDNSKRIGIKNASENIVNDIKKVIGFIKE